MARERVGGACVAGPTFTTTAGTTAMALDRRPNSAYGALAEGIHRFIRMKGWI
ncbi:hypothetical protein XaFJ1_GM000218 [Xanthomonas albilineans]|nr:hypothetical protein XaFJ1_GM000218 [Xanthomonas albilineans]